MQKSKLQVKIKKYFPSLLFTVSLLQVISSIGRVLINGKLADFEVYYSYSKNFLSGESPYQQSIPLNYPPSSLLFFTPFAIFTSKTAEIIFTALSLLAILASFYLLIKHLKLPNHIGLFLTALFLQGFPTKFTLGMGQVNLIVLFLVVFSFIKNQENKQIQAGIYWGIASMIKLIPLPLAFYFLIKKRYRALLVGLSLFLISNLSLIFLFPSMAGYFQTTLPGLITPIGKGVSVYDQSLRAFFTRFNLPQSYELSIFIGILLLFIALKNYLKYRRDLTFFSLILAITVITNSFAWQHHFVFLIPGYIAAISMLRRTKNLLPKILLSLSFSFFAFHFPDPLNLPTSNPFILSHTLLGSLILIWLLL